MAHQDFIVEKKDKDGNWNECGTFSREFCSNENYFEKKGMRVKPGQTGWEYPATDLAVEKKKVVLPPAVGEVVLVAEEKEVKSAEEFPPIEDSTEGATETPASPKRGRKKKEVATA